MFHNLLRWGRQNSTDGRAGASCPGTCKFPGWNPTQEIILREKDTPGWKSIIIIIIKNVFIWSFQVQINQIMKKRPTALLVPHTT